jgi:hypothetical protein
VRPSDLRAMAVCGGSSTLLADGARERGLPSEENGGRDSCSWLFPIIGRGAIAQEDHHHQCSSPAEARYVQKCTTDVTHTIVATIAEATQAGSRSAGMPADQTPIRLSQHDTKREALVSDTAFLGVRVPGRVLGRFCGKAELLRGVIRLLQIHLSDTKTMDPLCTTTITSLELSLFIGNVNLRGSSAPSLMAADAISSAHLTFLAQSTSFLSSFSSTLFSGCQVTQHTRVSPAVSTLRRTSHTILVKWPRRLILCSSRHSIVRNLHVEGLQEPRAHLVLLQLPVLLLQSLWGGGAVAVVSSWLRAQPAEPP